MAEKAAVLWSEHSEKLFVICFLNTGSECKCDGQEGGFKPLGPFWAEQKCKVWLPFLTAIVEKRVQNSVLLLSLSGPSARCGALSPIVAGHLGKHGFTESLLAKRGAGCTGSCQVFTRMSLGAHRSLFQMAVFPDQQVFIGLENRTCVLTGALHYAYRLKTNHKESLYWHYELGGKDRVTFCFVISSGHSKQSRTPSGFTGLQMVA